MRTKHTLKNSVQTKLRLSFRLKLIAGVSALTLLAGIIISIVINSGTSSRLKAETSMMNYKFTGNKGTAWTDAENWDQVKVPGNRDNVLIPKGKICNIGSTDNACMNLIVDGTLNLNIASSSFTVSGTFSGNGNINCNGTLNLYGGGAFSGTITNNNILTIAKPFIMNGKIINKGNINTSGGLAFGSSGIYDHKQDAGVIPSAKWHISSMCMITGTTGIGEQGSPTGLGQKFGNFIWDCPNQINEIKIQEPLTINGTFSVLNTGNASFNFVEGLSVVGNYLQIGGYVILADIKNASRVLDVKGNFKVNGGTFDLSKHKRSGKNVNSSLIIGGNFTLSSGTIKSSDDGLSTIHIQGDFLLNGGTLDLTGFDSDKALSVGGNWIITSGEFTQANGTVTLNGTGKQIIGGSSDIYFNDLIINNTSSDQTLTLISDMTINGSLTFIDGILDAMTYYKTKPLLIFSSTGIIGPNMPSDASHVIGPVMKITNSKSLFTFPVGDLNYCRPLSITPSNNHSTTWTAQYFNSMPANNTSLHTGVEHISTTEYWTLDRSAGVKPANAKIRLTWNSYGGVSIPSDMIVAYNNGTAWESCANGGSFSSGGNAEEGWVQTTNNYKSFGTFALGSRTKRNALPVEMIAFEATHSDPSIILNWATATEKNNDYFSIERSADGGIYASIGILKGSGTTNITVEYEFTDTNPVKGVNYYRLKQFDNDGNYRYSGIITVNTSHKGNQIGSLTAGPNPFTDDINVYYTSTMDGNIEVTLYDIYGREVKKIQTEVSSGSNSFILSDNKNLSSGIYMLGVISDNKMTPLIKMVKNN